MQRITEIQIANMRPITRPGENKGESSANEVPLNEEETEIMLQADGQILLFHLSGPMSFSSAKSLIRRHAGITDYQIMLLDLTEVPNIDFTTTRAMEDIIRDTVDAGRHIFLVGACASVTDMLEKQDVHRHIISEHICQSRIDALRQAKKIISDQASRS
jgi:SulP family sulfate permease